MLPAWATVAIALISAASGVVAGIVSTWLRIQADHTEGERKRRHERREGLRERRMVAADEFVSDLVQAITATRELAGLLRDDADKISSIGRWTGRVSRAGAEAARTVEEAENRYPRVALLFKPKSTVAVESAHAVSELRHAQAELKEVPPDFHEAEAAVSSAEHRLAGIYENALALILRG